MSKLVSNYLFTVLYQLLLMLTPVITTPYLSRILRTEGIGIEAYVTSIVQLFIVFIVLSLPMYGSRQIAVKKGQEELSKEFWSIYSIQLVVSFLNLVVFFIFISSVADHQQLFYYSALTLVAYSLDISWYFIGKEEIKKIALRNMIIKISGIILIFSLVKDSHDLPLYVAINGGTLLLGQLIMWIPILKEVKLVKPSYSDIKANIAPIVTLFIPQFMIQVYVLVNRIILGNISGEIEVGYYNQANKIIKIALGVISSLGTVLLPRMASEFAQGNKEQMKKYIDATLQFVLLVTLPMTFGMIAIAPNFVVWFFGKEFLEVSNILILMSPVIFCVGLANVFGIQILVATNQQNKYSIAISIGAVLSLIINFTLVFSMGSKATTIALLVAEAAGALIQMYFARKYFHMSNFLKMFLKYLILSLAVFVSVFALSEFLRISPILLTVIQLLIGMIVYVIGLILLRDTLAIKLWETVNKKFLKKLGS